MEVESERILKGHPSFVVCFTVWNEYLCSGSGSGSADSGGLFLGTIKVWNERGDCVKTLEGQNGCVWCLTVWKSKNLLCSGSRDELRMWNSDWNCVRTIQGTISFDRYRCLIVFKNVFFSSAGEKIVACNETGERLPDLIGHTDTVSCLAVWNEYLCSGSTDETIRVWNERGDCVVILKGHTGFVECLTVWKNLLCSGSRDFSVRIWNTDWNCVRVLKQQDGILCCLTVWNDILLLAGESVTAWKWTARHLIANFTYSGNIADRVNLAAAVLKKTLFAPGQGFIIVAWNLTAVSAQSKEDNNDDIRDSLGSFANTDVNLEWSPKTHWLFFGDANQVRTVLMMAALKPDGTPWHPEALFWSLPKDLLYLILKFSMSSNS